MPLELNSYKRLAAMKHALRQILPFVLTWLLLTLPASGPAKAGIETGNCAGKDAEEVVATAITAIVGAAPRADVQELFAHHLKQRWEVVSATDKPKYWRELKAKPELTNTPVYETGSPQSQAVLKIIRPVLNLYERDWDVAVIKQDAPFVGVFRQCIFIVSTGLLQLITDEELRGFAAHELAHECFVEELREADRLNRARAYHLVELKSDLVAALGCMLLKGDPLSIASGVARVEAYYLRSEPSVLQGDTHPASAWRRRCIELFLTRIKEAGVLTSQSSESVKK